MCAAPRVTVLMPVFNAGGASPAMRFASVVEQDFGDFECGRVAGLRIEAARKFRWAGDERLEKARNLTIIHSASTEMQCGLRTNSRFAVPARVKSAVRCWSPE